MISKLITGIVVLAVVGLLVNIPGVSPGAHALARDCLHLVQAAVSGLQSVLGKASA